MPLFLLFDFILLLLIRFFIKIVITIFGWATDIFFGQLPDKNKIWFYLMMILSFVWLYCLLAKVFPGMLSIFTGYIPNRSFTQYMRHFLYVLCIVGIPPGVGAMGAMITGVSRNDKNRLAKWLIKGFRYTIVLGTTMAVILICTPIIRIKRMIKRISSESMTMSVAGMGNIHVMDEIISSLKKMNIVLYKRIPSKFYSVPVKMINGIMRELFNYVSDRELCLAGENLNIYLNSTDIMLEGKPEEIEKAKIAIVKGYIDNDIFLTASAKARKIEYEICTVYKNWKAYLYDKTKALDAIRSLSSVDISYGVPYSEWALLAIQLNEVENKILSKNDDLKNNLKNFE